MSKHATDCRFCGEPLSISNRGAPAIAQYCNRCSEERRAKAKEELDTSPITPDDISPDGYVIGS